MQNTDRHRVKQDGHPPNQFDEAEYRRWSEKLRPFKPAEADWGFESFLGQTEMPADEPRKSSMIKTENRKKAASKPTLVEVAKEMNRPRFAESARKEENAHGQFKVRSPKTLKA
jgi:hypothetical protein